MVAARNLDARPMALGAKRFPRPIAMLLNPARKREPSGLFGDFDFAGLDAVGVRHITVEHPKAGEA
jgi:hypothetical protein